ncbi:MAG: hypothetical protein Tsb0021_02810 [Chlamydiales bacterium]
MSEHDKEPFFHKVEASLVLTVVGILLLFAGAVIITLSAPRFVDPSWTQPTSYFQVQMYEVADPRIYLSSTATRSGQLQAVYHLKKGESLLAFTESNTVRFVAPPELEKYVTRFGNEDKELILTSRLLMLRAPEGKAQERAEKMREKLREESQGLRIFHTILELYEPDGSEAFAVAETDAVHEEFIDKNYVILADGGSQPYFNDPGVIFIKNPREYRISRYQRGGTFGWRYDPDGEAVASLEELRGDPLGFRSRAELIREGEHIFAQEGCWYCHSDQTRTLVQDVVLNGSAAYPAPPSSSNEYIYQKVTFPGTRRIGPDLSRVAIKRPTRDWHQSHFWSPRTESPGSIMPSFKHFFDDDPSGTDKSEIGIPNYRFEAVFQYMMTKGSRITPPTEAWWLGRDPVQTLQIINGEKVFRE